MYRKTIMLTGATDGIGLETARRLAASGHQLLIHGRSEDKLEKAKKQLEAIAGANAIETYRADLTRLSDVEAMASDVIRRHDSLDVLINNAGVYTTPNTTTEDGLDSRFVVNTIAPYLLTRKLLPLMNADSRGVNLSSAAQEPVNPDALAGKVSLTDSQAYAQSKLALTMWSFHLAKSLEEGSPIIVAVNPASFLGSKMVKDAYGMEGKDLSVGADILQRAALADEFANANGRYFDNDIGQFSDPHPEALDDQRNAALTDAVDRLAGGPANGK